MPMGRGAEAAIAFVGVGTAAIVGLCIYLDHRRRSAPGYKDNIREKRRKTHNENNFFGKLNDMDPQQIQTYFMKEMSLGEQLLGIGRIEEGATHLANAVAIMERPQEVLNILSQTLPYEHFSLIVSKIAQARQQFLESRGVINIPNFANAEETIESEVGIGEILDDDELE